MKPNYTYKKNHIPISTPFNRRPDIKMIPQSITIHNTGNPTSTARNERSWLTDNPSNKRTASYHIVIDSIEAIECLPLNEVGWHAGDGSKEGSGNRTSIGIEICERDVKLGEYAQTLTNAVDLVAKMLLERNWGIDRLRRHYDWDRKNCPRLMNIDGKWTGWKVFLERVQSRLDELKGRVDKLELSNYQWNKLKENVELLLKDKVITSNEWVDKVEKRTLTNSELNWLNNEVLMRLRK